MAPVHQQAGQQQLLPVPAAPAWGAPLQPGQGGGGGWCTCSLLPGQPAGRCSRSYKGSLGLVLAVQSEVPGDSPSET
jgi:hypothetical protein